MAFDRKKLAGNRRLWLNVFNIAYSAVFVLALDEKC